MTNLKPLYRLKKYIFLFKLEIIIGFILVVIANILFSVLPKILQITIDKIEQGISSTQIANYVLMLVFLTTIYSVIRFLLRRIILGVARKIEYHLRNDYFLNLQKLSQRFYIKNKTGDLMARATNDVRSVAMTLGRAYVFFLGNVVIFVAVFILMITTNLQLTLFALIPFPLVIFIVYKSMDFFYKTYQKIQEKFADITAKTQENISGVRVVKAYVQEEHEIEQFMNLNRSYLKENLKLAKARGLLSASVEMLFGLAFLVLLWVGGNAAIENQISMGDFVAFTVWLGMLSWPIFSFGWVINLVQRASASMKRINSIMDEQPEIRDTEMCDRSIKSLQGEIEFKNVSFAYNEERVLKDINFKIEAGKTAAIVGPTGSGKTTLINLIIRLIDSTRGTIFLDEKNIRSIRLKVLRKNIGYVPQETFLFSETIEKNISFGVNNPEFKEIDWAAKISTIRDDLMNFPDKYQTLIGERGVNLSGGQKQRTAISRALLKKPKILILDDALSSVDTYTEEKILNSFKENNYQQTNLIISHRISSVKHADIIFVLLKGEIIEQGTHDELIDKRGFYAELYQQQLLEAALEEL
jgi:ATP-binding cassette, subfamily B, multidrug efflux pump